MAKDKDKDIKTPADKKTKKRQHGKPEHVPTDVQRDLVSIHSAINTLQIDIARMIGIDAKTLRKHYRDELDLSAIKANGAIGGALYNKALAGDTTALIWWTKTRMGWKEQRDESILPQPLQISFDVSGSVAEIKTTNAA